MGAGAAGAAPAVCCRGVHACWSLLSGFWGRVHSPYPHSDRVAVIWDATRDGARLDVTFGTYRELMARARSLETLAVMRTWQPTIIGEGDPERLEGQRVSATFFQALGISPRRSAQDAAA